VAFLTFDRPQARNALTWAMYDALVAACDRVDADDTVRVFVVRAEGEAFAAGTDIRQFTGFASGEDGIAYERKLDAVIDRLERVSVPTIAQVHGVAAGAGCAIALTCDLRVCSPAAQFGGQRRQECRPDRSRAHERSALHGTADRRRRGHGPRPGHGDRRARSSRRGRPRSRAGAGGERAADDPRHEGNAAAHRGPAAPRGGGSRRSDRRLLRQRGLPRRRRLVHREAASPLHRAIAA
jgi:hypothetical protein